MLEKFTFNSKMQFSIFLSDDVSPYFPQPNSITRLKGNMISLRPPGQACMEHVSPCSFLLKNTEFFLILSFLKYLLHTMSVMSFLENLPREETYESRRSEEEDKVNSIARDAVQETNYGGIVSREINQIWYLLHLVHITAD